MVEPRKPMQESRKKYLHNYYHTKTISQLPGGQVFSPTFFPPFPKRQPPICAYHAQGAEIRKSW